MPLRPRHDRPPREPVRTHGRREPFSSALAISLALLLASAPALASAPELFGFGVRSPAMAGTGVAFADDFEAVYENPAGIARAEHRRLTLGYVSASYHLSLDGQDRAVDGTSAIIMGVVLPLPLGGALTDRLAIGLGFHLPTNVVNRASAPLPDQPFLLLDNRTQTVSVMAVASARLPADLSIGAGVIALAALVGGIDLLGLPGGHFGARSEEQLVASYAPLVGARWDARPWLRAGATYRGESDSRYDLAVVNHLGAALPFDLPTLRIAGISQYDPHTVAVEVALGRPREGAMVALQLQWQHWSAMPALVDRVTPNSPLPPSPGLRDTVTARAGFEWSRADGPLRTSLRAGYAFVATPAPDAALSVPAQAAPAPASSASATTSRTRFIPAVRG